jgi:hypothetical protein
MGGVMAAQSVVSVVTKMGPSLKKAAETFGPLMIKNLPDIFKQYFQSKNIETNLLVAALSHINPSYDQFCGVLKTVMVELKKSERVYNLIDSALKIYEAELCNSELSFEEKKILWGEISDLISVARREATKLLIGQIFLGLVFGGIIIFLAHKSHQSFESIIERFDTPKMRMKLASHIKRLN